MEQYINKSALVAEIKRLAEVGRTNASCFDKYRKEEAIWLQQADVCDRILSFLDTLEVKEKEVNLEKEFDNYTKNILACDVQFEPFTHLYNCAKYFYELGLKAKGE